MTTKREEKEEEEAGKERIIKDINKKKAELYRLATSLFAPVGRNPYYLKGSSRAMGIKNMAEVIDNCDAFTREEIPRLASWIEHLGDKETADKLREMPEKFKEIIAERYDELREFYN